MKSFFKKSVISMFVMGMAGTSFAMHNSVNQSGAAWSPHMTGWFIGVDGLDLRPENGDLDYATLFPAVSSGSFSTQSISPDYQWSWRLYGGIKFTDNDDITLSWLRMRANDNESVGIPVNNSAQPRFGFSDNWTGISGKVDFDLDNAYLVWGHTINFNNPWSVRYAAGFEYAKLNSDMTVTETNTSFEGVGYTADSHLNGYGPRVEFDMTYHLPYNFALFADANAALLSSTRKISQFGQFGSTNPANETLNSSYFSTRHVVIPHFGERLGVSYTCIFGQAGGEGASLSALTIDAGWQVDTYIHAIERPVESFGDFADFSSTFATTKTSNFGDQGFFIGLKYSAGAL
jgi:hypothetical protein